MSQTAPEPVWAERVGRALAVLGDACPALIPHPEVPTGKQRRRYRLTGYQENVLRLLVAGCTIEEIAFIYGRDRGAINRAVSRCRTDTGCRTTAQTVAEYAIAIEYERAKGQPESRTS